MSKKIESETEELLRKAVVKLLDTNFEELASHQVAFEKCRTVSDYIVEKPDPDEDWAAIKEAIDRLPPDSKPDPASILFTLVNRSLIDLQLTRSYEVNGFWPCPLVYTIDRDRHIYDFEDIRLHVSILQEGKWLLPIKKDDRAGDPQSVTAETIATTDPYVGEYLYILIELEDDPSQDSYTMDSVSRSEIPLFSDTSEISDLISMRNIHSIIAKSVNTFEACCNQSKFKSKEYSTYGINPSLLGKRKMGDRDSPTTVQTENKLLRDLHKGLTAEIQLNPSARLLGLLLMILRKDLKCSVKDFHHEWIVPPEYINQVVSFNYPQKKPTVGRVEFGYDNFTVCVLYNTKDYFVVFRVSPCRERYVVQKIVNALIPSLKSETEAAPERQPVFHDRQILYFLVQWMICIDDKFLKKMSVGFSKPSSKSVTPRSRTSSTSTPSSSTPTNQSRDVTS